MHKIRIESLAEKQILKLSQEERKRVIVKIKALATDPKPAGCKKMSGSINTWRIRVGDYRIIYDLYENERVIRVWRVKHRREAYR